MTLRDLSFWGIVKATLFVTMLLPFIAILIAAPFVLLNPETVTFSPTTDDLPKLFGIVEGLKAEGSLQWIAALIIVLVNLLAASKILQLIAKFTPIGRIQIGPADDFNAILPNKAPTPQP